MQRMRRNLSGLWKVASRVADSRGRRRFLRTIVSVALLLPLFTSSVAGAQGPEGSRPPVAVRGDGGFRSRQLTAPPPIDGREWIPADVISGDPATIVQANDRTFSLLFREARADTGDFERYQLYLRRGRRAPVRIDDAFTGWVYVTPDSRYIFTEPLYVLDVPEWKQYRVFDVLGIQNYTSIEAISRDGRRVLVSRSDCAFDCRDQRREYYELTLPR
jgi:hypothetical protein